MSAKRDEFRKTFKTLPDILIQDAVRNCGYLIPSKELLQFHLDASGLKKITQDTVTLSIPDGDLIEPLPPFLRSGASERPSVLIQYRHGGAAYFLDYDQLQKFRVEQPNDLKGDALSFILPVGLELLERIPLWRRRLLQSVTGCDDDRG